MVDGLQWDPGLCCCTYEKVGSYTCQWRMVYSGILACAAVHMRKLVVILANGGWFTVGSWPVLLYI